MCVLCKIDKPCQDINYLKFDKCVEIMEFSNRQSRAVSLPPPSSPASFEPRFLCSDAALPLQHTAFVRYGNEHEEAGEVSCAAAAVTRI